MDFCDTLAAILKTAKAEQHKNCFRYGELYSLNYYSEVKEKDRTYYEVYSLPRTEEVPEGYIATVYKGNIIKNLIMDCQSYTKYRPNETTGGIFVSWRRKEELPTGA